VTQQLVETGGGDTAEDRQAPPPSTNNKGNKMFIWALSDILAVSMILGFLVVFAGIYVWGKWTGRL
jgi:hypothetical protein